MIMMRQWWVGDESLNIDDHDVLMMIRWGISNEPGDELVIINDESVISRWKSMMRRLVGAESVMSRCLFRNSRISRYQGRIFPLTYYLNLPSPVTSTRTSVRLFRSVTDPKFRRAQRPLQRIQNWVDKSLSNLIGRNDVKALCQTC